MTCMICGSKKSVLVSGHEYCPQCNQDSKSGGWEKLEGSSYLWKILQPGVAYPDDAKYGWYVISEDKEDAVRVIQTKSEHIKTYPNAGPPGWTILPSHRETRNQVGTAENRYLSIVFKDKEQ